jgi:septal ring factor EnvC (AmiA/AmiB activator)
MHFWKHVFFVCIIFSIAFTFTPHKISAQQMTEAQIQEQEAKWRAELEKTEKEIAEWEAVLSQTKKGTASLERDASILNAKINEAKAFIRY